VKAKKSDKGAEPRADTRERRAETRAEVRAESGFATRGETGVGIRDGRWAETKSDMEDEKKAELQGEMQPSILPPGPPPPETHTFREILSEPSSFKWLYDVGTLNKFLEEAKKLDTVDKAEIREMRTLLVDRNPQMGNLSKYPNNVLRVFARLLGLKGLDEELKDTLGKVELAEICVRQAKEEPENI
jgi:hypothetical protein